MTAPGAPSDPGGPADDPFAGRLGDELRAAAAACLAGGRAAMRHYGDRSMDVGRKGRGDPVTAADLDANRAILASLRRSFPDDPVLSEELPPPPGGSRGRLWVVDPLDGTKEFMARNGEFSIMAGLAVQGRSVAGAVYRPDPGALFLGVPGRGAWQVEVEPGDLRDASDGSVPVSLDAVRPLRADPGRRPPRLVRSRSHPDELLRRLEVELEPAAVIPAGSVGVKCSLIATGAADLYVHPVAYIKEWDTCAPEAVLRGAGGRVTDCAGQPLAYGKDDPRQPAGILAGTADAWESAAPVVRRVAAPLWRSDDDRDDSR